MAKFYADVDASLSELAQLSQEGKWAILQPAAEIAQKAFAQAVQRTFKPRTGELAKSPVVVQKSKDGEVYALVQLKGRHPGSSRGIRMKKGFDGKRRKSGHYYGTNAEVGYFLNYGTPRIPATHWYENTEERIEPEIVTKIEEGYDAFLKEKNLV